MESNSMDVDWLVIGSGFGGSVAALRLAEKGYRVAVVERGRRYVDGDLPTSSWQLSRFVWAPVLGLRGIMRNTVFPHVFSSSQTGVGGGSLIYGGVLFRAQPGFFDDPQWRELGDWEERLAPEYAKAERMLGVQPTPFDSTSLHLTRKMAKHFDVEETFGRAPTGVYFGTPGQTVEDPYFDGEGPPRTGCTRCGSCLVGCRVGAANVLTKNYLWFAEKLGVEVIAEREVTDVVPLGAGDGSAGYLVTVRRPGPWGRSHQRSIRAGGVVFAGGAVGTNELLSACKLRGSLPRISGRLGRLARTNSETVLSVRTPNDQGAWRDVAASSRVVVEGDTQLEFLTYGRRGDLLSLFFTILPSGAKAGRPTEWLREVARHPLSWVTTLWPIGWSRRTMMLLVMQARDNAITFRGVKRRFGLGYRITTEADVDRPAPSSIDVGNRAIRWLAAETGGIAQSSIFQVLGDRPMTAHVIGGAVIGADETRGVVDEQLRVFGYQNMIVCDAAALPANPGVNPALSIAALAEYAMTQVPANV